MDRDRRQWTGIWTGWTGWTGRKRRFVHRVHPVHPVHTVHPCPYSCPSVLHPPETPCLGSRVDRFLPRRSGLGGHRRGAPSGAARGRKVRTPQGRALPNRKAGRPDGKWHRKHTADGPFAGAGKGEKARQELTSAAATRRLAKPRPVQGQIGGKRRPVARDRKVRDPRVGRWRRRATAVLEEWPPSADAFGRRRTQNSAYRPAPLPS